jgi:hypothetical protein
MTCQHEGCHETENLVPCYLPDTDTAGEPDDYFCAEHCHDAGYCFMCGGFFAGICDFDFSKDGMCETCRSESDSDDDSDWDEAFIENDYWPPEDDL